MLQRERRAKLTHDMYFACGIVGASALLLPIRRRIEKKREKNHHDYDGATHSLVFVGSLLLTSSSWIATEKLNQGMFAYLPRACAAEIPYQNHYSWIKQAACFHRTSLQVRRGKRLDVRTGDTGPVGRRHFISELALCLPLSRSPSGDLMLGAKLAQLQKEADGREKSAAEPTKLPVADLG